MDGLDVGGVVITSNVSQNMKITLFIAALSPMISMAGQVEVAPEVSTNASVLELDQKAQIEIPQKYSSTKGVVMQVESFSDDRITFLLINNSDRPILIKAYGITSPKYRFQVPWKDGEWRETLPEMECFPRRGAQLHSKRCCRFEVAARERTLRVGIDFWEVDTSGNSIMNTVWSEPVERKRG